jgi:hypothetical protein
MNVLHGNLICYTTQVSLHKTYLLRYLRSDGYTQATLCNVTVREPADTNKRSGPSEPPGSVDAVWFRYRDSREINHKKLGLVNKAPTRCIKCGLPFSKMFFPLFC